MPKRHMTSLPQSGCFHCKRIEIFNFKPPIFLEYNLLEIVYETYFYTLLVNQNKNFYTVILDFLTLRVNRVHPRL